MPAKRKEITGAVEGNKHIARFRHPIREKVIRFDLGDDANWRANLAQLNRIFLDPTLWHNPPAITAKLIRDQWLGNSSAITGKTKGNEVREGFETLPATSEALAAAIADKQAAENRIKELVEIIAAKDRELEHWRGKKLAKKDYVTLQKACDDFLASYLKRDADHTRTVKYDLQNFVDAFGAKTTIDKIEGEELAIFNWLRAKQNGKGESISAGRHNQIRTYILKMLKQSGVDLDKGAFAGVEKTRRRIKWLARPQAEAVVKALKSPWQLMLQIQIACGLRPDELLTLQRQNFNDDFSVLILAKLGALTLKKVTPNREIPIPQDMRPLIEWRIRTTGDILFPEPETGKPWANPKNFNRRYRRALQNAADAAGVVSPKMDCRIGRRCCASYLLQAGVSAEKVAALLGNTPGMVLDHYGDPKSKSLELNDNVVLATAKKAVS